MKKIEYKDEYGELEWLVEVPDVGWLIEDGKLNEYPGDEAFARARNPNIPSGQVFWNRDHAVIRFNEIYDKDAAVVTPIG